MITPGLCLQQILRKSVVVKHPSDREGEYACAEMLPWDTKDALRAKSLPPPGLTGGTSEGAVEFRNNAD